MLMETPVMRLMDRKDDPSTIMLRIWTRLCVGNLFMPTTIPNYMLSVKQVDTPPVEFVERTLFGLVFGK